LERSLNAPAASPRAARGTQRKTDHESGIERTVVQIWAFCELAHTRVAKNLRPSRQVSSEGMQMLAWTMGVMVAIGLTWSAAVIFKLVPVFDSGSVAIPRAAE